MRDDIIYSYVREMRHSLGSATELDAEEPELSPFHRGDVGTACTNASVCVIPSCIRCISVSVRTSFCRNSEESAPQQFPASFYTY